VWKKFSPYVVYFYDQLKSFFSEKKCRNFRVKKAFKSKKQTKAGAKIVSEIISFQI